MKKTNARARVMKIQRFIFPYLEDEPKPERAQIISMEGCSVEG
jgi:hypothetical protein